MPIKTSLINVINNRNKSFVQASLIEASIEREKAKKAGNLFLLAEINEVDKTAEKLIFVISQLLEKNYYLNEKIFLSEQLNGLKIEAVFETALVKTNRELLEFIDQEKINFNFRNLNLIVGLEHDERIYFSSIGRNKSFLIHQTTAGYRVSDINPDGNDNELEELISGKIFSSIISGEIPAKAYIVFANDSLSQYIINDNFVNLLNDLKIEGATEQIKINLAKINNYSNFCALLLQNCPASIESDSFRHFESNLNNVQEKTEELLKTPGSINREKVKKTTANLLTKLAFLKIIFRPFQALGKIKIKKEKTSEIIVVSSRQKKLKKVLLVLALLLLIALLLSFFLKKKDNNDILVEENVSSYEELIRQKQNQIDSALLYNNETQATEIITDLQKILANLTDKEKKKIDQYEATEEKLNEQVRKIQKMNKIEEPTELIDLKNVNELISSDVFSLDAKSQKLYVADSQGSSIYSIDLDDRTSTKISQDERIAGHLLSNLDSANNHYFLAGNRLISIKDQKATFSDIKIKEGSDIIAFAVYNGRIYLLDSTSGQILKYENNGEKYSEWLKEQSSVKAVSLAVDYEIYLLNEEGEVNKYLSGQVEKFALDQIQAPLEKADIIKSSKNYLFILDKSLQRLAVFLKADGTFIQQYSSDKFNDLKDLAVDEGNKKAYLLNDQTVYSIDLIF